MGDVGIKLDNQLDTNGDNLEEDDDE